MNKLQPGSQLWMATIGDTNIPPYLSGGISKEHCIAAFQSLNATSFASSLINLVNPGVHDISVSVAPEWSKNTGWKGDGATTELLTDIVPVSGWSMIVQFADANLNNIPTGTLKAGGLFGFMPVYQTTNIIYFSGQTKESSSDLLSDGFITIAGQTGYRDGANVPDVENIDTWWDVSDVIKVLHPGFSGFVKSVYIYDITLTPEQQAAIIAATRALPKPAYYDAYIETSGNDSTAIIGDPLHPFATINGALDANPGERVNLHLGLGEFGPITCDNVLNSKLRDGIRFYGSGKPTINTEKTGLVGGTRIQGPLFIDRNDIELYNLGVDSGSIVCNTVYSGTTQEAISNGNYWPTTLFKKKPRTGFVAKSVTALVFAPSTLHHCFLVENNTDITMDDITTCHGFGGLVVFSSGVITNVHSIGHGQGAIFGKISPNGYGHDLTISNIVIDDDVVGDTNAVIFVSSTGLTLFNYTFSNIVDNTQLHSVTYNPVDAGSSINNCNVVNMSGSPSVWKNGNGDVVGCLVNGIPAI